MGTHDLLEGVWVYLWLLCAVKKEDVPERDVDFYFSFVCVRFWNALLAGNACMYIHMYVHTHVGINWINQDTETSLRLQSEAVAEQEMEAKTL